MKHTSIIVVMLMVLSAGCGSDAGSPFNQEVTLIEVAINENPVEVGDTAQLTVRVMLGDGTEFQGLTTSFTHPRTGDTYPIEWSVSDEGRARIDSEARLIPRTEGFVTIGATLINAEHSRVIRIEDPYRFYGAAPLPDQSVDGDDTLPDEEDPLHDPPETNHPPQLTHLPCQGHAVDVASFSPGVGDGFGSADFPDIVLGPPEGNGSGSGGFDVLSLGRLGEIVLDLGDCHLIDGVGVDLIVFENAFLVGGDPATPFAELGAVSVSDDGVNFVEFACSDKNYPFTGCAGWHPVHSATSNAISPFDVANAGGEGFDLATIGVTSARYVRIRDVSDFGGTPSAGFDLDAVSVVNGEVVP